MTAGTCISSAAESLGDVWPLHHHQSFNDTRTDDHLKSDQPVRIASDLASRAAESSVYQMFTIVYFVIYIHFLGRLPLPSTVGVTIRDSKRARQPREGPT